jgi:tetratricopeptide (TPR) repeat protein
MKYRVSLGMLFWFGASICVLGQTDPARRVPARLDELHESGAEALLNLDYDKARQTFKETALLFPDDPMGPEMLAWTLWLESLNKVRLRQAAIYSSQSFAANPEDKPDPQVTQEFRDLIRRSTQLTGVRLQASPHDPRALYTLGNVETLHAAYEITIEGRFLAGLRDASSGVDKHREVIKLDPNFHDAELTIGLYDYIVGNLPLAAKMIANVTGVHGSKKRGLQTLERVAGSGHWERDNARLLLMVLYKHEQRFAESLALSRSLQEKYSRNYLFRLETADTLTSQAATERQENHIAAADNLEKEALDVFGSLFRDYSSSSARRALGVIHFCYAEDLLALRQPERAAPQFLAVATVADADPSLITRAHLRTAQSFDLAGKRNEALAEYRIVLSRPNTRDSLEQARRGLREPYRGK